MKVLVAGGAGFLGGHLVDALLLAGNEVVIYDDLSTSPRRAVRWDPPRPFLTYSDLRQSASGFQQVFHLASPAAPDYYKSHPLETMEANSGLTRTLLELAHRCGASFLYASSSEVYGNAEVIPTPETYWGSVNPVGIRSPYDEAKRFSEAMVAVYRRSYGLRAHIVRIFNTYGPRMRLDDGRVMPSFIGQALSNQRLLVHAPGTQTRSFCYVDDTIKGILDAAEYTGEHLVFNLGNPQEISMWDLAVQVAGAVGRKELPLLVEGREEEIARRVPDTALARRELGWGPDVSLEVGIRRTLLWYREHAEKY